MIDKSFDRKLSSAYHESIQISLDGFCVFIRDCNSGKLVFFAEQKFTTRRYGSLLKRLKEWLTALDIIDLQCCKSIVLYDTDKYTLTPEQFYSAEYSNQLLSFAIQRNAGTTCLHDRIEKQSAYLLYEIPASLETFLRKRNKKSEIKHAVSFIADDYFSKRNAKGTVLLHVHLNASYFHLLIVNENSLTHLSSFQSETNDDRLFFLLAIAKECRLNVEALKLTLSGRGEEVSDLIASLQHYMKDVQMIELNQSEQSFVTTSKLIDRELYPQVKSLPCE